jgi:hypothetical protein
MRIELNGHRHNRGCGCGGCFGCLGSGVMFAMVPLLVALPMVLVMSGQQESDRAAIAAFNACPAVTDALGTVREANYSMGCGESSSGGGYAQAAWTISVEGPKGSATGRYVATKLGSGPWEIQSATLQTASGQSVVAVPCAAGSSRPAPREPNREPGGKKGKRR